MRARVLAAWSLGVLAALPSSAGNFTNFESGHVRPLALSPDGEWLFAVNTPDACLTLHALTPTGASLAADVPVFRSALSRRSIGIPQNRVLA